MNSGGYLNRYLDRIENGSPGITKSILNTVTAIVPPHIANFSYQEHVTGLLMGEVQSGKTSQMFGLMASAADLGFKIFIMLTSDNVNLQQQTYKRALRDLEEDFNICGETDADRFVEGRLRRPTLVILKKNSRVLGTWRDNLASAGYCVNSPLFIFDDEADAASPNIRVNQGQQSIINSHLDSMKHLANSSLYIQVTATPQAVLLQSQTSGWKPMFVHYFSPGKGYLGGRFFYSEPTSYAIRTIGEHELDDLIDGPEITEGLTNAILTHLLTSAHIMAAEGENVSNMLIHPSAFIDHHDVIANKIGLFLSQIPKLTENDVWLQNLFLLWRELQSTKPDLIDFEEAVDAIGAMRPNLLIVNSDQGLPQYDSGMNIIIGGNSLARGITFPALQTVYYCRSTRRPQADTYWQHCRMFGYDRNPALMRLFLPESLLSLFTDLNNANNMMIRQIKSASVENISLLYPRSIRPTRPSAVDRSAVNIIAGGTNYFPREPKQDNGDSLDDMLREYADGEHEIDYGTATSILELCLADDPGAWGSGAFLDCVRALEAAGDAEAVTLILRRGRTISRGTGTLLSPTDRMRGATITDRLVLTAYRLEGRVDLGWAGRPFWISNVKFAAGGNFHIMLD